MKKAPAPAAFLVVTVFLSLFGCTTYRTILSDAKAVLSVESPYCAAGVDARLRITVTSKSGRALDAAMMDPACLRIYLEGGGVLRPATEETEHQRIAAGTHASLSRVVNLEKTLEGLKTQTVEVEWVFEGTKSKKIPLRVYEWDLEDIEAVIETDQGEMVVEFFPRKVPITVKNFVDLILNKFYDNLTFHRVVPDFMIQGGCPNGDGTGDPGYFIQGEFTDIGHERGVISMARTADPDSAGCQFFIMLKDNPELDGLYAAFGRLTSGMDTLDRIAGVPLTAQQYGDEISRPVEAPRIESIRIRRKAESSAKK